jgi:hypothetical protein
MIYITVNSYSGGYMQTFLPYRDFVKCAKTLDKGRLGKQRVEAKQIIDLLDGITDNNWKHHVATRSWIGYTPCLKLYFNTVIEEWVERKYENNMPLYRVKRKVLFPPWFKDDRVFQSHRCNLVRKDPVFYGKFGWKVDPEAPYFWPVPMRTKSKQKAMIEYWGQQWQ